MSVETENDVIERLLPELEAEGYEVLVHPTKLATPAFMGIYRPDILARRSDKNLAIEIKRKGAVAPGSFDALAGLFRGRKDWDFRVVWIDSTESADALAPQSRAVIEGRLAEIRAVASGAHREFAMLMAWSVFEAAARALMPDESARPQPSDRILELLAREGYLTPDEADRLRGMVKKRNRLVHGALEEHVSADELSGMLAVIDELVKQLPE